MAAPIIGLELLKDFCEDGDECLVFCEGCGFDYDPDECIECEGCECVFDRVCYEHHLSDSVCGSLVRMD